MVWRRAGLEIEARGAMEAQRGESFKNFKNEIVVNHLKSCRASMFEDRKRNIGLGKLEVVSDRR